MKNYEQYPLYYKTIRLEWYHFPYYFPIRKGDVYCRKRDTQYRQHPYLVGHIDLEGVGDWVEIVLIQEQLRIQFSIA